MLSADTVIIIPTYNERENVPGIVRAVRETVPDAHVLIVDDASPDGTADLAEELFGTDDRFHLLRRAGIRGLGRSYVESYLWALSRGYERIVQMDADFSHSPSYIPPLVQAAATADVVLGSRYCPGGGVRDWPVHRRALSRFANLYVSLITGASIRDATSGFRCYRRRALEAMQVEAVVSNGYAFQVEMTYRARRAGLAIAEVPIVFADRTQGSSKMSSRVIWESVLMPWRLRFGQAARLERESAPCEANTLE